MQEQFMNGVRLHEIFEIGYRNLKKNIDTINDLNVFPVPDGDTGTNLVKTFGGGLHSVSTDIENVGEYSKKLSQAVLLSARGNSGVIFSQFIYGIARGFEGLETIKFNDLTYAFKCAVEDAYKSIISPAEGTILTVIREAAEFLANKGEDYDDFQTGFSALLKQMKITLAKTPDLLPVLKEAGVVDSGGAGLVCFVEGICACLNGESVEDTPDFADSVATQVVGSNFGPDSELEYGYCTEFILQLMNAKTDISSFNLDEFIKPLQSLGDSLVAVCNDSIVKIHIHTFTPEKVLEYGRTYGEFVTLKIENMSVQHSEIEATEKKEHVKYAIVAVASGEGIVDYFYSIGATAVIDGGQTNNPSVDAFLNAFRSVDAEHIVVLPNNSNIILTAEQAADIYKDSDVRIIPTKSVVEGYSALSMMNLWCDTVEELIEDMSSGLGSIDTGYVTTATRDTVMDGVEVKKDKYIGIDNKTIINCSDNKVDTAYELIKTVVDEKEKEVIIVFYGASVNEEEMEDLKNRLENEYPLCDIGVINGKQGIYDFVISME